MCVCHTQCDLPGHQVRNRVGRRSTAGARFDILCICISKLIIILYQTGIDKV